MKIITESLYRLSFKVKTVEPSELYVKAHHGLIKYMGHNRIEASIYPAIMGTI